MKLLTPKTIRSTSSFLTTSKFGLARADFKKLSNEIYQEEMKRMDRAAGHVRKKILERIDTLGIGKSSGDLKKGMKKKRLSNSYIVGAMAPAWHAHLLELGTDERFVKNYKGEKGQKVSVGRMKKTPFIFPTFADEKDTVMQIMSEPIL